MPKHRGLTWFAVPTGAEGVTVNPITQINGSAEFCEEFLDDVIVTDADIIGEVNRGWTVTQTMLVYERGAGESDVAVREPRKLAPDLVALARQRRARPGPCCPPGHRPAPTSTTSPSTTSVGASPPTSQAAAEPDHAIAAYSKLAAGTYTPAPRPRRAGDRRQRGADVGDGDARASKPAIDYLNGRIIAIAAGTNEMQRNGIGERVLGLPREPSFDTTKPFSEVLRQSQSWSGKVDVRLTPVSRGRSRPPPARRAGAR